MRNKAFHIKAVLFDFDGTLTEPGSIDFPMIKKKVGCPPGAFLLEFIETLSDLDQRNKAKKILDDYEINAAAVSRPNKGAEILISWIISKGIKTGIISRNSLRSIYRALRNFKHIKPDDFDIIISRDDPVKPKPSGEGIRFAANKFNIKPEQVLIAGDFHLDMEAGNRARAVTVYLGNESEFMPSNVQIDFSIKELEELKGVIRLGLPLASGKLPNYFLQEFLSRFHFDDPSILTPPGVGEDTTAVSIEGEEVIVLKSDPITFVTDSLGHYAVLVNANDIATSGATPRWFLTTLLFPVGTTPSAVQAVMSELTDVCSQRNITLCGGHTEITDSVTRPVVIGMMTGTLTRDSLIQKQNMAEGDRILLTKRIAVEGTAIIANEFSEKLKNLGMTDIEIDDARKLLPKIGILEEAGIAAKAEGVCAMHDITEGGFATALEEFSAAGGNQIRIDLNKVPVYPQTEKICGLLGLNPYGLIGSGSLLICCRKKSFKDLMSKIKKAGIDVTCIGKVAAPGKGVQAFVKDREVEWPHFETDEITKLY